MVKCSWGIDGRAIGCLHNNTFFDKREYEKEFTDKTSNKYTINLIAENMYAQVDDEGHQF